MSVPGLDGVFTISDSAQHSNMPVLLKFFRELSEVNKGE